MMKMKSLFFFLLFLILSTNGQDISSDVLADVLFPDQFISMMNEQQFKCQGCGMQVTIQQAEMVRQVNMQYISHMRYRLKQFGFEIYSPPPIIVNWFDFDKVAQRENGGLLIASEITAQTMMMSDMVKNSPAAAISSQLELGKKVTKDEERIGNVFGTSLKSSLNVMRNVGNVGIVRAHEEGKKLEEIPKITEKKDMTDAREKMKNMESDVYFIFFHNEFDTQNHHIKDYLEVFEEYSDIADFYQTDTGFALFWAEQLEIYRMFDTIIAVHPQSAYIVRNDNPTIQEKATYLPIEYQYYDEFVQLQNGDFMNFVRLHLDLPEEDKHGDKDFPEVQHE